MSSTSSSEKPKEKAGGPPANSGTCAQCSFYSTNMMRIPGVAQTFSSVCMYYPPVLVSGTPAQVVYPPVQPNWSCGLFG